MELKILTMSLIACLKHCLSFSFRWSHTFFKNPTEMRCTRQGLFRGKIAGSSSVSHFSLPVDPNSEEPLLWQPSSLLIKRENSIEHLLFQWRFPIHPCYLFTYSLPVCSHFSIKQQMLAKTFSSFFFFFKKIFCFWAVYLLEPAPTS